MTVPPIVAPANVTQDDTEPIHAVTDLCMQKLGQLHVAGPEAMRNAQWIFREQIFVVIRVEGAISSDHLHVEKSDG